ncbi:MAG: hypothetical protein ACRD0U_00365, partial [Acidimicrobiales bacterium]
ASSMHLVWVLPARGPIVEAAAVLTVVEPPTVERLYFWALQVSFPAGAAHLGLQWHPAHPRSMAANFGGYARDGGQLAGSESPLPSARGNPNTRDFSWEPGRPYRLTIAPTGDGWFAGRIGDEELRRLPGDGDQLSGLMVWSEVFARCDDPTVVVRWSGLEARGSDRAGSAVEAVRVNYQAYAQGGCTNTTARADGDGVLQITNVSRDVPQGTVLPISPWPAR